jgi:hypothetical protein
MKCARAVTRRDYAAHNVEGILAAFEPSCPRHGVKVLSSGSIESSRGVCFVLGRNEDVTGRMLCIEQGRDQTKVSPSDVLCLTCKDERADRI